MADTCCRFHLVSQEAQLCEEVLSQLDFISHCALLHLRPHGFSLLADALLHPDTAEHLARQISITNKRKRKNDSSFFVDVPLLTDTASVSPCQVWSCQTGLDPCSPAQETDWKKWCSVSNKVYFNLLDLNPNFKKKFGHCGSSHIVCCGHHFLQINNKVCMWKIVIRICIVLFLLMFCIVSQLFLTSEF